MNSLILFAAFVISFICWLGYEIHLGRRESKDATGNSQLDMSGKLIMLSVWGSLILAAILANRGIGRLPHATALCIAGLVVVWIGMALRVWTVRSLGKFFRLAVVVQDNHAVVDTGPYRMLRHPAYAATLISIAGFGLALGSWASLLVTIVIPFMAMLNRIGVEEHFLLEKLGAPYAEFMSHRARLIPGIW